MNQAVGIQWPSVKGCKNWRRGSERIALSKDKESRKESKKTLRGNPMRKYLFTYA
jgi:hypothetical protein